MTASQRAAITRVLIDLIKADKVIDSREMELYDKLKKKYSINREDEITAYGMTMHEAVEHLRYLKTEDLDDLLSAFVDMAMSDDFCAREEALLITMLKMCLAGTEPYCDVISTVIEDNWFDERQVLYVESHHDKAVNYAILQDYRIITKELKLCGLEFVYLPHILHHYVTTPRETLHDVVSMLSPTLTDDAISGLLTKIRLFKTDTFCIEQLHHKLGFESLADTPPALLLRVNQSRVGPKVYTNFLRIELDDQVKDTVMRFVDMFLEYNGSDRIVISHKRDEAGKFLYSGFYRQLFEILLLQKSVECEMKIDFINSQFSFPELGLLLTGIHRREKALYVLFIYEASRSGIRDENGTIKINGGISFAPPQVASGLTAFNRRMALLQKRYARIYSELGGEEEEAPDILRQESRLPMLAVIRKCIMKHKDQIYDADRFTITRNGREYSISAPLGKFLCSTFGRPEPHSILESSLFKDLDEIKK